MTAWVFDKVSRVERRFRRIAESIKPFDLQYLDAEPTVDEHALFGELVGKARASRFLGYYSLEGIERALETYGVLQQIRDRGYHDPQLTCDLSDLSRHRLRIFNGNHHSQEHLVLDFAAHLGSGSDLPLDPPGGKPLELLVIDWLLLQSPHEPPDPNVLLPGQTRPGLGIGVEIGTLISLIARRLELDGCLASPAWYHNAVMYRPRYSFVEPTLAGRFRALQRDTEDCSLFDVSWATELGCVRSILTGGPADASQVTQLEWTGGCQVHAVTPLLRSLFHSPAYRGIRDAIQDGVRYEIDWGCLEAGRGRASFRRSVRPG